MIAGLLMELAGLVIIFTTTMPLLVIGILLTAAGLYPIIRSRSNVRNNLILYGLILVTAGGFRALRETLNYQELEEHPATTMGVVLDTGTTSRNVQGGKRWIEYRYRVNAETYTARGTSLHYLPGDTIVVRYATTKPTVSIPLEPGMGRP